MFGKSLWTFNSMKRKKTQNKNKDPFVSFGHISASYIMGALSWREISFWYPYNDWIIIYEILYLFCHKHPLKVFKLNTFGVDKVFDFYLEDCWGILKAKNYTLIVVWVSLGFFFSVFLRWLYWIKESHIFTSREVIEEIKKCKSRIQKFIISCNIILRCAF